jgi:hypothetical protein
MKYEQLTIMQKIGLKGAIQTWPSLAHIKLIWVFWNFKIAVEYLLNEDINALASTINQGKTTNHETDF